MNEIKIIKNNKKKLFDHSCNEYYQITIKDKVNLLFTAAELNKALDRYKKWSQK